MGPFDAGSSSTAHNYDNLRGDLRGLRECWDNSPDLILIENVWSRLNESGFKEPGLKNSEVD